MTAPPPSTSESIPDEWIQVIREIAQREGRAMRLCDKYPAIQFKDLHDNVWRDITLPGGGVLFTSIQERDLVAKRLEGRT